NTNASVGSSTGVVTGVTAGNTTITYTMGTGCIATTVVTINPLPATITGTASVCTGLVTSLSDATSGGTWSSSNGNASIDGVAGVVTGSSAGTSVITYMLGTGCIRTTTVTVNQSPATITGTTSVCIGLVTSLADAVSGGTW